MKELVCLAVFTGLSAIFAVIMVVAGFLCQYKRESAVKNSTYECGVTPFKSANSIKFDIRYFNYAILFLIFDIETIFLYPFAVSINMLGLFAIFEAFLFVGILLLGLYFAINKKVLRWL
ncbi:NADH-quinone oxidoreductase subunit A [bacterium]|nr:NADH-quinone oxidoreductase subunit A [bacterium]